MIARRTHLVGVILSGVLLLTACGSSTATEAGLQLAPVDQINEIISEPLEGLVVLDIRTPEEFAAGHIAGAVNIDYYASDFEQRLGVLDLDVPYVMYCNSGNRSSNTLPLMDSIGFSEVYELDGGIQAWLSAGLPTEQ